MMDSCNGKLGQHNEPELGFYRQNRIYQQQKDDLEPHKLEEVE